MKRGFIKSLIATITIIMISLGGVKVFADTNNEILEEVSNTESFEIYTPKELSVSGDAGTKLEVPVKINGLPKNKSIRSVEIEFNTSSKFDIEKFEVNNEVISAESNEQNNQSYDNKYRVALINTSKNPIQVTDKVGELELGVVKMQLKSASAAEDVKFSISRMIIRCDNDEDIVYNLNSASTDIKIVGESLKVEPRILYKIDEKSGIYSTAVIAVEFTNLPSDVIGVEFKDFMNVITTYYSEDFTKKNNKQTYLIYNPVVSETDESMLNSMKDINNYNLYITGNLNYTKKSIKFGDFNNDGIDAQDALSAMRIWIGKELAGDENLVKMNVNADGEINTRDAIDIVDSYITGKEFKILSK